MESDKCFVFVFLCALNNYSCADVILKSLQSNAGSNPRPTYHFKNITRHRPTMSTSIPVIDNTVSRINPRPMSNENATENKAVRCYCNLLHCVPQGHACHSRRGRACFTKGNAQESPEHSEISSNSHKHRGLSGKSLTRGCIEMLSERDFGRCKMQLSESNASQTETATPQEPEFDSGSTQDRRNVGGGPATQNETPSGFLQCCDQDGCNIARERTLIIKEIEAHRPSALPPSFWWVNGPTTIGVTVTGVIILAFLFLFASRILTEEKGKGRSNEYLQNSARATYCKVPYYIERTPPSLTPTQSGDSVVCSVLCMKSKKQDVIDYCRSLPLSSADNRLSLSCPSSLSFSREDAKRNPWQPQTPKRGPHTNKGRDREFFVINHGEGGSLIARYEENAAPSRGGGNKFLASHDKGDNLIARYEDSSIVSRDEGDMLVVSQNGKGDSLLARQEDAGRADRLLVSLTEGKRVYGAEDVRGCSPPRVLSRVTECSHRFEDLLYSS